MVLVVVLLAGQTIGCGQPSWHADLQPVSGECRVNGEPAVRAMILMHPKGHKTDVRESNPWAIVDETGTFHLSTYEPNDGIPLGEYDVTITWLQDPWNGLSKDRLKGKYRTKESPVCSIHIEEGTSELAPIEINLSGVLPALKNVGPARAR